MHHYVVKNNEKIIIIYTLKQLTTNFNEKLRQRVSLSRWWNRMSQIAPKRWDCWLPTAAQNIWYIFSLIYDAARAPKCSVFGGRIHFKCSEDTAPAVDHAILYAMSGMVAGLERRRYHLRAGQPVHRMINVQSGKNSIDCRHPPYTWAPKKTIWRRDRRHVMIERVLPPDDEYTRVNLYICKNVDNLIVACVCDMALWKKKKRTACRWLNWSFSIDNVWFFNHDNCWTENNQ